MHGRAFRTLAVIALAGLMLSPLALRAAIKLFLKDGSYVLVKSYEVKGDRVRYYNLQSSDWEEMPKALVDFAATERAETEKKAEQAKQLKSAEDLQNQRLEIPTDTGYQIRPDVRLPGDAGVYAYDGTRVVRLIQEAGHVVTDKKRIALIMVMPGPLLKKQALVVLSGPKAAVRITSADPVFYIQDTENWPMRAQMFPLTQKKESRVVEKIQSGIGLGKPGEKRTDIPLDRKQLAAGVFELKATQPLDSGEYALGEMLNDKLNIAVWDFGIDLPGSSSNVAKSK
ncbi:MAG TPA: hypothetical protein VFZ27_00610 [Terriglobia bacterium]|nr:hypothetical protein [Terriglobia bacterium]